VFVKRNLFEKVRLIKEKIKGPFVRVRDSKGESCGNFREI